MWPSTVVLADTGHPGIHCLQTREPPQLKQVILCGSKPYKHTCHLGIGGKQIGAITSQHNRIPHFPEVLIKISVLRDTAL
jgi:hypothetical protein